MAILELQTLEIMSDVLDPIEEPVPVPVPVPGSGASVLCSTLSIGCS